MIFTDGYFPDHRKRETDPARVGIVAFVKNKAHPLSVSLEIKQEIMDFWIKRKNQIAMVELFAPVLTLFMMGEVLKGMKILLFVDSEPVEGALVKGYSSRSDMCLLTGLFWRLAHKWDIKIYIDRVPTDCNPSDGLSRKRLEEARSLGWELLVDPEIPAELFGSEI